MIASIAVKPNTATITAPAGWTLQRRTDNANATASSLAVYYRVAGAGEPANYTWTLSANTGSAGGIQTFSNVDTQNPIDIDLGQNTASALTHASPTVTTTLTNTMLVTSYEFASSATWTPPGGMFEAVDTASLAVPNAAGISLEANYATQPAAGSDGHKDGNGQQRRRRWERAHPGPTAAHHVPRGVFSERGIRQPCDQRAERHSRRTS